LFVFIPFFVVLFNFLEILSCEMAKDIKKIDEVVKDAGLFFSVVRVRLK
jgi:hypothetical protein